MAANILVREFKIPVADKISIDISVDSQVRRVFARLGFVGGDATNDQIIYRARDLNPLYPGVFDLSLWEIGRNWCHPRKPDCANCYLLRWCPTGPATRHLTPEDS
jgi:endonuclease III